MNHISKSLLYLFLILLFKKTQKKYLSSDHNYILKYFLTIFCKNFIMCFQEKFARTFLKNMLFNDFDDVHNNIIMYIQRKIRSSEAIMYYA